jgi:LysM repeat protein
MGIDRKKNKLKKNKILFLVFIMFGILFSRAQEMPVMFLSHKVKKKETLINITRKYKITETQLFDYNSLLKKVGLRRRMVLRIPVYPEVIEKVAEPVKEDDSTQAYAVKPKETKWRIAYNFQMTIPELEALNPQIKKGLKEGQEIRVPFLASANGSETIDLTWNSKYNYYKVLPKEGYYRIEKKIGVTQKVLDSLNPNLLELGLQAGMILRVPGQARGELKIQDDLLVERISLLDSLKEAHEIDLALLLPFKAKDIEYDSIADTRRLLQSRNLHTLSADFYAGVLLARSLILKTISLRLMKLLTPMISQTPMSLSAP